MATLNFKLPFVIAGANRQTYAIPSTYVREILRMAPVVAVPNVPPHIRGVVNLRDKIIQLIDLRVRLGMPSFIKEIEAMIEMLNSREQDHVRWLKELEASVREKRAFTLARDPTKCAFGKWYYNYHADDRSLHDVLARFDAPHRRIHQIADIVCGHSEKGNFEAAYEVIEATRKGDLGKMIALFGQAREVYQTTRREMAIVLDNGAQLVAISVDTVESVERLDEKTLQPIALQLLGMQSEFATHTARRKKDDQVVLMLEAEKLFPRDPSRIPLN